MRRPSEAGRKRRSSELDKSSESTSSECTNESTSAKRKQSMPRHTPPPEDEEITLIYLENALQVEDFDKGFGYEDYLPSKKNLVTSQCKRFWRTFPVLKTNKYVN